MIELTAEHLLRLRGLAIRESGSATVTSLPGGVVTRPRGRGLETAELRPFEYGDDPRHLDRNATARTGQAQVRLFHAERDRTTILIADFRPSMLWGTRRTLRSIAAAEALTCAGWRAITLGGRVGLLAITAEETILLSPQTRDRAMVRTIGAMVRTHQLALKTVSAPDPPLTGALSLARRVAPRGSDVLLASAFDHLGTDFNDRVLALSSRTHLRFLRIADAFETSAPAGQYRFATQTDLQGRIGRPGDLDTMTELSACLRIPLSIHDAAQSPEVRLHG